MKRKLLLNTLTSLLAQLTAMLCGFILPRLILEQFGSEVNGLTQSIKQFLGIISFLDLGVGQVVRSALYRPLYDGDRDTLSAVMDSGRRFYRRLAGILGIYVLVLVVFYPILTKGAFGWTYTAALIAAMAVSSFAQYCFGVVNEQLVHADQRSYVIHTLQIATTIANTLVSVVLIRLGMSIQAVKLAASVIFLLRPMALALYVRRYPLGAAVRDHREPIAQKWNGVAQHVSAVVLDGTDTIVLTFASTLSSVSVYSVYYMVISNLQQFYQAATAGLHAAAGAIWASGDRARQNALFERVELILHYGCVFLFSCTALLIVPFVRVYTHGLTDADYIRPLFAALLVAAYAVRCLRTPYNIWILAAGHYKQTQVCHITAAAMNLILSVLAVRRFGLIGVAIGTLCAMVYQTLWMAHYCVRSLLKRPWGSVGKQFLIDILTAAVILGLCSGFRLRDISYMGWFFLALKTAAAAAAVTVAAAFLFHRKQLCKFIHPME